MYSVKFTNPNNICIHIRSRKHYSLTSASTHYIKQILEHTESSNPGKVVICVQECIRAPPKRGRYWEIHPRRPRYVPREILRVEGNLDGGGDGFPNISLFAEQDCHLEKFVT